MGWRDQAATNKDAAVTAATADNQTSPLPTPGEASPAPPMRYLESQTTSWLPYLQELWNHRVLAAAFVSRDVRVRYHQAIVGAAWVVLQPLSTAVIFAVLFQFLNAEATPSGVSPALFALVGLLPWQVFSVGAKNGCAVLVAERPLITKVYFPRALLPLTTVVCAVVDSLLTMVVVAGLAALAGDLTWWSLWQVLPWMLITVLLTLGVACLLATLNGLYRDVQNALPMVLQVLFFLSPCVFDRARIPVNWQWIFWLNPLVAPIEGVRHAMLGQPAPGWGSTLFSVVFAVVVAVVGLRVLEQSEGILVDRI